MITHILFFLSASFCFCQSGTNPFDIAPSGKVSQVDSVATGAQSSDNIFDIQRSTNPVSTNSLDQVVEETQENPTKTKEKQVSEPIRGNPFEVSHIPLRKSKLKKEADAFKPLKDLASGDSTSNTFIFWFILISAMLIAVVINIRANTISRAFKSLTNGNILTYNKREERQGYSGQYIILYISFFINAGVLLYLVVNKYQQLSGLSIFGYCLLGVTGIYFLRHLSLRIFSIIFPVEKDMSTYAFSIQVYNIILGIILIPLNLIIAFGPTQLGTVFMYVALGVVGLFYIVRSLRGLIIGMRYVQGYAFHFFLYLCSFEIIPLLLLVKLI